MSLELKMNKKKLAISLSKLKCFKGDASLEQYSTDSEIAADLLWYAFLHGDIEGKTILDLGCGNGILGIGALLLGAKRVYFLDIDKDALNLAKENAKSFKNASFFCCDVREFDKKIDVVIENPPFGVQKEHADKVFLEKAMGISEKIYSFHKIESADFINALAADYNFRVKEVLEYDFFLKRSMNFHKKDKYKVRVGCWILEKLSNKTFEIEPIEIVESYPDVIRKGREKKGLKQEELAQQITEKESVIHKLETGHLKPRLKLAKKLEIFLGIELVQNHEDNFGKKVDLKNKTLTIGDLINIKIKKLE